MPKTRLFTHTRRILINHASGLICCPDHKTIMEERLSAVHAIAVPIADEHFPRRDMDILEKYRLGQTQNFVEVRRAGTSGRGSCVHAALPKPRHFPSRYGGNSCEYVIDLPTDHPIFAAVSAHEAAVSAHKAEHERILADYVALINASRNYEDVVAVWPEASGVADRLGVAPVNAMSVVSEDLLARIAADIAFRRASAE